MGDREHRRCRRARSRPPWCRRAPICAGHRDEAAAWGRAGKAVAERGHLQGSASSTRSFHEGRLLLSPMPPVASGIADYSSLVSGLRCARRASKRCSRRRARQAPAARNADVSVYHIGNDPDAHGWIVDALKKKPGVVVLHGSPVHHLIAGIDDRVAGCRALSRRDGCGVGVPGHRSSGLGVLDNLLALLLWEKTRAGATSPSRQAPSSTWRQGVIVHCTTWRNALEGSGLPGPALGASPHPAWPVAARREPWRRIVSGDPLVGCFGNLNMNKRIPAAGLTRLVIGCASGVGGGPPAARWRDRAERFDLDRRLDGALANPTAIQPRREHYVSEDRRMWSPDGGLRRAREPPLADDGRDASGSVIRGAGAREGDARLSDVGWFCRAARRRRAEGLRRRRRDRRHAGRARAALARIRTCGSTSARRHGATSRSRWHGSIYGCWTRTSKALEGMPPAAGCGFPGLTQYLGEIAEAAAEGSAWTTSASSPAARRASGPAHVSAVTARCADAGCSPCPAWAWLDGRSSLFLGGWFGSRLRTGWWRRGS